MKKNLLLTILLNGAIVLNTFAQTPDYLWAKRAGGTSSDPGDVMKAIGNRVSTDASGNIFLTGTFNSASITFGTTTLNNAGGGKADIFLVKYNALGTVLWAKSSGGTDYDDISNSVSTDASGNVFITGYFNSSSITFGTTTLNNAAVGKADLFLVKYDASGTFLWAKSAGGVKDDDGRSVSTDANGNVFVTGMFSSDNITFGITTLTNGGTPGAGISDILIVKYDASGNVLWANRAGGARDDDGRSVSTDDNGNAYLAGSFPSTSITFGTTTLTNADNTGNTRDVCLVKYDASGAVLWAKSSGGTSSEESLGVSTDVSGNVLMTGRFESSSITFGTTVLTNAGAAGTNDGFLVKYDASGNVLWAKSFGGTSYFDTSIGVCTDANGNVFLTGAFSSTSITFGTTVLTNAGGGDIFLVKYNASGNVIWATRAGGANDDYGICVSTDANGNVIIAGLFYTPTLTLGATTLTNADNTGNTCDIFIAKLNALPTGIESFASNDAVTIYPNPFSSSTTLQSDKLFNNATLTVYNSFGQQVKQIKNISGQAVTLSRDNLPSGIYFLRLTENNISLVVDKLVITDK
ncbi:MAG: T9SS type A sorting domain-containing protein [Bacteroidia bacterium]|nr:T9SS type A sorting domain-containing protein [Bacteroidia bacterium]